MYPILNVRDFGAVGDGTHIDSESIQSAINSASEQGGGIVEIPAGTFACYTLELLSDVSINLAQGTTLLAAYPKPQEAIGYQLPEESESGKLGYQDFGHSYFRNSLIFAQDANNIAITGFGLIDGLALGGAHHIDKQGEQPSPFQGPNHGNINDFHDYELGELPYHGNKAIALKNCRNVCLRDFSLFRGGHFAVLATGVDSLTIDNLKVDTNRDALDIDCCRNVRITNCSINSPFDDAIVLKSSYALNEKRECENIAISNCLVSGYQVGSLLDSSFDKSFEKATDGDGPTGRIKIGTESNGDFRNIAISNCLFDHCRGLAFETVDGARIEDVVVSNITMRDVSNAPLFVRVGDRRRGPAGTKLGSIKRVSLNNISVHGSDSRFPSLFAGHRDSPIEDLQLSNIRFHGKGGISMEQVYQQPEELVNRFFLGDGSEGEIGPRDPFAVPEREKAYPEPSMFGLLPASGIYARHVKNIFVSNITFQFETPDDRPLVTLESAECAHFDSVDLIGKCEGPAFYLTNVSKFLLRNSTIAADIRIRDCAKTIVQNESEFAY